MRDLSKKEELIKCLHGEGTKRVPWLPFVGIHAAKVMGKSLGEFLYDSELISEGVVRSARLYNASGIPICFDLQLEAEILGAKTKILEKMPPAIIKHPFASNMEFPKYEPNSGRLKIVLDAIPKAKKELGEDCALYGLVTGILTLAYQLRGRQLLDDIKDKKDEAKALLNYCKEVQLKTISAYVDRSIDVVAVVEPMCSVVNVDFCVEELFPLENELFDNIRREGLPSSFFLCGDVNEMLKEICNTSCDNICVCSNVDLNSLKQYALRANKSFGGNLNPRTEILNASKEECVSYAKKCLDIGGNKGYILSSGCDLPYDTPSENLIAISKLCS